MRMRWLEPLFVHFHVPRASVEARVPDGLVLDADGRDALISLVALGAVGPAPAFVTATPLARLLRYPQLAVQTYVNGPHGPGRLLLELRVERRWAFAARALGLPCRRDPELRYEVDASAVALRAGGIAVRGLPAPEASGREVTDELERRTLGRDLLYGQAPRGSVYALSVRHQPWRLRAVELAPDSAIAVPGLTPVGELAPTRALAAHVAASVDVRFESIALLEPAGRVGRAALSLVQSAL